MRLFLLLAIVFQIVIATQNGGLVRSLLELTAFLTTFVLIICISLQKGRRSS